MKKTVFCFFVSLFLLSGCSQNESNEIVVNNPYEITKDTSTLSYYDTENNINIDGFNVIENNLQNLQDKNNNIIVDDNGTIRCIIIVNDTVKTFKSISVGDDINKIENTFNQISQLKDTYSVLFNDDNTEENPDNQNKEDNWIWITYYTDGSKITSIQIYDVLYGRELR